MAWRMLLGTWAVLATAGAAWLATGGELSSSQLVDGVAVLVALVALFGVVRLPWDLYFAARGVQRTQADSTARQVAVRADEQAETGQLAKRLLAFAVSLHVLGAAVCAAVAWGSGGQLGWLASGAFLLTMGLRPATAMVGHVRARLAVLQRRAKLPTVDAASLGAQLATQRKGWTTLQSEVHHEMHGLAAIEARLEAATSELRHQQHLQGQRHQAELDRIGLEMERALERLTTDQEVLSGLRAFLAMVRER